MCTAVGSDGASQHPSNRSVTHHQTIHIHDYKRWHTNQTESGGPIITSTSSGPMNSGDVAGDGPGDSDDKKEGYRMKPPALNLKKFDNWKFDFKAVLPFDCNQIIQNKLTEPAYAERRTPLNLRWFRLLDT